MQQHTNFDVIYLTGPPATGKSTLVAHLQTILSPLETFVYSKVLSEHVSKRHDNFVSQDQLRAKSSLIVTPDDVQFVDDMLKNLVESKRSNSHIIIDSHAVTKESYGYRVTPFSYALLSQIRPTKLFCLYTEASVIIERIQADKQGRPNITSFEADFHTNLQANLSMMYGLHLGIPIYFLDSSKPISEVASQIVSRLGK